jgi:hypothetical protein
MVRIQFSGFVHGAVRYPRERLWSEHRAPCTSGVDSPACHSRFAHPMVPLRTLGYYRYCDYTDVRIGSDRKKLRVRHRFRIASRMAGARYHDNPNSKRPDIYENQAIKYDNSLCSMQKRAILSYDR